MKAADGDTHLSPCQCSHVQDYISGQILAGVHHSISQHQAALGIRVVDLHGPSKERQSHMLGSDNFIYHIHIHSFIYTYINI